MTLHEILGESLRCFELCCFLIRSPNTEAIRLKEVNDPERERIIGADDRQLDSLLSRKLEEVWEIFCRNINIFNGVAGFEESLSFGAGIARCAPHPSNVRRLRKFPNQGVFATARTDDKDFQSLNELCNSRTLYHLTNLPCL